jgi:SnoaL-like protein
MDTVDAAKRWRETWRRSWPTQDAAAIASLYASGATYRSHPFRDAEEGGALGYVARAFADEREGTRCWFGAPIVDLDRAAIEYWARLEDHEGVTSTLAGVSVLRFRDDGMIVDHLDYWVMDSGAAEPPPGWGGTTSHR